MRNLGHLLFPHHTTLSGSWVHGDKLENHVNQEDDVHNGTEHQPKSNIKRNMEIRTVLWHLRVDLLTAWEAPEISPQVSTTKHPQNGLDKCPIATGNSSIQPSPPRNKAVWRNYFLYLNVAFQRCHRDSHWAWGGRLELCVLDDLNQNWKVLPEMSIIYQF